MAGPPAVTPAANARQANDPQRQVRTLHEKRTAPRRKSLIPVLCQTADGEVEGSLSDISTGGGYLNVPRKPRPGSRVTLRLRTPLFPEPLSLEGTVVDRQEEDGVGVRFDPLTEDQRRSLNLLFWG